MCWDSPDIAPGDERVRLKAVRVVSESRVTGKVDISKKFEIEIEYWNLKPGRRYVSIHLYNSLGTCVFVSANIPGATFTPDPWFTRPYPLGLFRTSCTIPGNFLNDGQYSVSVFINPPIIPDPMISIKDILTFTVEDTGAMRQEHVAEWPGTVRPRLGWETIQI